MYVEAEPLWMHLFPLFSLHMLPGDVIRSFLICIGMEMLIMEKIGREHMFTRSKVFLSFLDRMSVDNLFVGL